MFQLVDHIVYLKSNEFVLLVTHMVHCWKTGKSENYSMVPLTLDQSETYTTYATKIKYKQKETNQNQK